MIGSTLSIGVALAATSRLSVNRAVLVKPNAPVKDAAAARATPIENVSKRLRRPGGIPPPRESHIAEISLEGVTQRNCIIRTGSAS